MIQKIKAKQLQPDDTPICFWELIVIYDLNWIVSRVALIRLVTNIQIRNLWNI